MPKPEGNAALSLDIREIGGKRTLPRARRWVGLAGSSRSPEQASGGSSLDSAPPAQCPDPGMRLEHRASSRFLQSHPRLQGRGPPRLPARGAPLKVTRPGKGPASLTWQRHTMSASCASRSTTFPLPSSPHCAPSTTVTRFPPGRALGRPQSPLGREVAARPLSEIDMALSEAGEPGGDRAGERNVKPSAARPPATCGGRRSQRPAPHLPPPPPPPRGPPPSLQAPPRAPQRPLRAGPLGAGRRRRTARSRHGLNCRHPRAEATPHPRPGALLRGEPRESGGKGAGLTESPALGAPPTSRLGLSNSRRGRWGRALRGVELQFPACSAPRGRLGAAPECQGRLVSVSKSRFLFSVFKRLGILKNEMPSQNANWDLEICGSWSRAEYI